MGGHLKGKSWFIRFNRGHTRLGWIAGRRCPRLFWAPDRLQRPPKVVLIVRGLPGSGKSRLAKALKDIEVRTCTPAPGVHARVGWAG